MISRASDVHGAAFHHALSCIRDSKLDLRGAKLGLFYVKKIQLSHIFTCIILLPLI